MLDKMRKILFQICDVMDVIMAVAVVIGIGIAAVGIFPEVSNLWLHREETAAFLEFLDSILSVIIGIEFLKMLCRPNTENIIEALVFLIARHMIVGRTTVGQDFVSVISICVLFLVRYFMRTKKPEENGQ